MKVQGITQRGDGYEVTVATPVSPAWVERNLRTIGGLTSAIAVASISGYYFSGLSLQTWETATDLLAVLGATTH